MLIAHIELILVYIAALYQRYSGLESLAEDIRRTYTPEVVVDQKFQDLKRKWFLLRDYLKANPTPPEADQSDFVNDVLNGRNSPLPAKPKAKRQQSVAPFWTSFTPTALVNWVSGSSSAANSRLGDTFGNVKDPEFVDMLRPLEATFPVLTEITKQIYERLADSLTKLEGRIVQDRVGRLVSAEQKYQNDRAKNAREAGSRTSHQQAFETLLYDLQSIMNITTR